MLRVDPVHQTHSDTDSSYLASVVDAILPDSLQHADIEARGRARLTVGLSLIFCGVSLATIAIEALRGIPAGIAVGTALGLAQLGILIGIYQGLAIRIMGQALVSTIFLASAGIMIGSAAQAAGAVLISLLIPLISLLVIGPRAALGWTLATLCSIATTAIYASSTDDYFLSRAVIRWNDARFLPVLALTVVFIYTATMILDRALRLAKQEARASKDLVGKQTARYRSVVESLGDVLMDFDDAGRCVFVGANCEEVMGHPASAFLGSHYLLLVHPDDADALADLYRFSAAHPGATRALPLRIRAKGDDWLHVQLSSRCYFDESEKLHFTAIVRDTTSMRLAEMTLRHHERLESAGTLSAGIAHQINNPMGSILTASQFALISLRDGDMESVERALKDNVEQATRCGNIVRSLLHFAARESPTIGREDLVAIVNRSREFAISYAGENSIEIEVAGHLEPLWVDVNSIEIEQVLINLLRNAIEARPASQRIDVLLSASDSHARIEVRDDGCGISESDRAQIFDPFFSTRVKEGGSGLGLSVAHGIIRDHGGSMDVKSQADHGTRVGVELPLADH